MLGREVPDVPCTAFFSDIEWKALYCYVHKTPDSPEQPPSLGEAIYMLGKIGGHLGRKTMVPPVSNPLARASTPGYSHGDVRDHESKTSSNMPSGP
ncbi:MAG: IS4 family transposase [Desulfovermiculus sp.]|nr:IS4 family transposase [Desulfovermiculus sp.]